MPPQPPARTPAVAPAPGAPAEGTEFLRLAKPVDGNVAAGKVEVIEFFWYGCGHCDGLEPVLNTWARKLPAAVLLRKVHVGFSPIAKVHQRLFFALEALGKEAALRSAVFDALHRQRLPLRDLPSLSNFVRKLGVDAAAFESAYNSFGVNAQVQKANQLQDAWHLESVPTFGVGGRYLTSPSLAAGRLPGASELAANLNALKVVDYLVERVRKGG
jgi:thiol:disulfide interchange protein DsbA